MNEKGNSKIHNFPNLIPESLYNSTYNSSIAREIFFIETWRDIRDSLQKPTMYRAIRISAVLRQLYIERKNGKNQSLLHQVNKKYNISLRFACNTEILPGSPYPLFSQQDGRYVKDIRELKFEDLDWSCQNQINMCPQKEVFDLTNKDYLNEMEFLDKVCVTYGKDHDQAFSAGNIIFLMANFNGGVHYDDKPFMNEIESFHLNDFNPLIPNNNSVFIRKIKEISLISLNSLRPLVFEIAKNLYDYVKNHPQSKVSAIFEVKRNEKEK